MSERKAKGTPARVRVPAIYLHMARLHHRLIRLMKAVDDSVPEKSALYEAAAIARVIALSIDPRRLRAAIASEYGAQPGRRRPKAAFVNANGRDLDLLLSALESGDISTDHARELLGVSLREFSDILKAREGRRSAAAERAVSSLYAAAAEAIGSRRKASGP